MEAVIERMNARYEVTFSTPLFDLPRRNVDVLENLYGSLKSTYHISSSDMQVAGGTALSDVKIRMFLLGGRATFEVTVDKLVVEFHQLNSSSQFSECEPCILNCEDALRRIYPKLCADAMRFYCSIDMNSRDGTTGKQLLRDAVGYGDSIDLSEFGDVERFPAANITMHNEAGRWYSLFNAFSTPPAGSKLSVSCNMDYLDLGISQDLGDWSCQSRNRLSEYTKLVQTLLGQIGVNVHTLSWVADEAGSPQ